ncbi:class II fructose-1,6-bisphosphate aldolase [Candidatus Falkowbacteria bacterium]|jgi:fructose-bisphosphate aldolase, class II|nr:class II fructose-1,6-bisphosphate aldolase [Candidatus Falkowbacteria bacterium]MBT4433419.1 class II fructose-1,6-bisphosphate aldolase [Candidatus Falkowbacteria bacterium]
MLVHIKEIVPHAKKHGYAIGAFNTSNLEVTLAIIKAAVTKRSPVIIQVSESAIRYSGLKAITHIVETIAKNESVDVPVALHLDHGKSFHSIAECINAGFSSIMIDASDLPFDENMFLTKSVVDYSHKREAWVQGEIGRLIGVEDDIDIKAKDALCTDPDDAKTFAQETGVDTLAVAVGQSHGAVNLRQGKSEKINIKQLEKINKKVKVPLVLHGASDIAENQIKEAVKLGVSIVNIDTEIRMAFSRSIRKVLKENKDMIDPRKILTPVMDEIQKVVENKIKMFGSENKA